MCFLLELRAMSGLTGPLSWEQTALLGRAWFGGSGGPLGSWLASISPVDHTVFGVFYLFWLPTSSILSP